MKLFCSFVMSAFTMHVTYSIVVEINPIKIEKILAKTDHVESSSSENTPTTKIGYSPRLSSVNIDDRTKCCTSDAVRIFVDKSPQTSSSILSTRVESVTLPDSQRIGNGVKSLNESNDSGHHFTCDGTANRSMLINLTTTGTKIPSNNISLPTMIAHSITRFVTVSSDQPKKSSSGSDNLHEQFAQTKEKERRTCEMEKLRNETYAMVLSRNVRQNSEKESKPPPAKIYTNFTTLVSPAFSRIDKSRETSIASSTYPFTVGITSSGGNSTHITQGTELGVKSQSAIKLTKCTLQSSTIRSTTEKLKKSTLTSTAFAPSIRTSNTKLMSELSNNTLPSAVTLSKHTSRTLNITSQQAVSDTSFKNVTLTSKSLLQPPTISSVGNYSISTGKPLINRTLVDSFAKTNPHSDTTWLSSTPEQRIDSEKCPSSKSSNRSVVSDSLCRVLEKARRKEIRQRCGNDPDCWRRYGLVPSYVPGCVRRATVSSRDPAKSKKSSNVRPLLGNVTSNAGFLLVNPKHGTRLFFWFVRSTRTDPRKAPLVVWLQGQPGWSSLYSFFEEHGPYRVVETSSSSSSGGGGIRFKLRESAWTNEFNVLYLDHCVGCGFSMSLRRIDYKPTYETVTKNVYRALNEFFAIWPEFAANDLYLAGEHGCAKYIPLIAHAIYERNAIEWTRMNLKGLLIGGPYVDADSMVSYGDLMHTVGLIDENELNALLLREEYARALIRAAKYDEAIRYLREYTFSKFDEAGYRKLYDLRYLMPKNGLYRFESYMPKVMANKRLIRSIHAQGLKFPKRSAKVLIEDIMRPVDHILTTVLKNYKICYYNGQFDLLTPYSSTAIYFSRFNWIKTDAFYTSNLNNWYASSKSFSDGYWKYSNNLTHVLIRNAGHTVGSTRPETLLCLLKWFVEGKFEKSYTPPSPSVRYLNVFE